MNIFLSLLFITVTSMVFGQNPNPEIVLKLDSHQYLGTITSKGISVYNNKTLLVASRRWPQRTPEGDKPMMSRIYKSDDLGKTWEMIFNEPDSSFGEISDLYQTGESQIVAIHSRLREDTTSLFWRPKYFLSYTENLGKTWIEYDLEMPLRQKPWNVEVDGNELTFLAHNGTESIAWQSLDYGKTWNTYPLGFLKYGTIHKVKDSEFALFADSIYYLNNLDEPEVLSKVEVPSAGYHSMNVIFKSKDSIWTSWPEPSGVGDLQKTVLIERAGNGWNTVVDRLENDQNVFSTLGLFQNTSYRNEMMCFIGPSLFYTSLNQGASWEPQYIFDDTLNTGPRGVVAIKDEESGDYHLFYLVARGGPAVVGKYTIKNPTSIHENSGAKALNFYPNPTRGDVHLNLGNGFNGPYEYTIISISGKEFKRGRIDMNAGSGTLECSSLQNGVYLIKLSSSEEHYETLFIKK